MGSTSVNQQAQIPDELKPLVSNSVGWTLGLQNNLPLNQFTEWNPRGVPDLSNLQTYGMQNIPGLFGADPWLDAAGTTLATIPELTSRAVGTPAGEQAALAQLAELTSRPIGQSPATVSGMEAWKQGVLPTIQNEASLMGLGRSGPALINEAISHANTFTPLVQQEIANRMQGAGMLQGIGQAETERALIPRNQTIQALQSSVPQLVQMSQTAFNQRVEAIQQALRGGQISREAAQQQLDAAREEFSRLQALSEAGTLGPLGQMLPSMFGRQTETQKDPWSAIMGKAIAVTIGAGLVASLVLQHGGLV